MERVRIRPLVFPPKDLPLPLPFPLYKNITILPPPPTPNPLQEMFAKYRRSQALTVPEDTFGKSSCWKCPSDVPSMEPFRARVGEVHLVPGLRTRTVA